MRSNWMRWRIAARVLMGAVWVQCAVWTLPLPRILSIIESKPRRAATQNEIDETIRWVLRVSDLKWFVIRRNCLKKNLLSYYLLVTADVRGLTIHVGVQRPDPQLSGHCWLTLNGQVYLDTERNVSKYTVMYSRGV